MRRKHSPWFHKVITSWLSNNLLNASCAQHTNNIFCGQGSYPRMNFLHPLFLLLHTSIEVNIRGRCLLRLLLNLLDHPEIVLSGLLHPLLGLPGLLQESFLLRQEPVSPLRGDVLPLEEELYYPVDGWAGNLAVQESRSGQQLVREMCMALDGCTARFVEAGEWMDM